MEVSTQDGGWQILYLICDICSLKAATLQEGKIETRQGNYDYQTKNKGGANIFPGIFWLKHEANIFLRFIGIIVMKITNV